MVQILRVLRQIRKRKGVGGVRRGLIHREYDVRVIRVAANRRVARHPDLKIEGYFVEGSQTIGARSRLEIVQRNPGIPAESPRHVWNFDGVRPTGIDGGRGAEKTNNAHCAAGGK